MTDVKGFYDIRVRGKLIDRPIIVGAHWDSVTNTTGFDDNGSGVAVLLEVNL